MALNKTLVLGIGNPLMQDDGVGVHVVQHLKADNPDFPQVEFMDGGTLGFSLIGAIEDATNLIVIDAAQLSDTPGSIRIFLGEEMDLFLGRQKNSSVHDVTLVDLMSIALLSDQLPVRRALIGIQPGVIDWSTELTPTIKKAIPNVCNIVLELIEKWRT
ncbi:HyaD/HybD family hydrogenase maturation endopeptidase [Methylobacter psychrophilus]|uniref:HyaD/HybD family hydrogenase maturation endopeptidase n=1 Tax=Methylobacter psychrophilus TaxID=96941 RepID=UPI0021D50B9D|nr:HyaD/HybD family hydrogenase maturation endopeptidase [Methylobacter psychrophilus]